MIIFDHFANLVSLSKLSKFINKIIFKFEIDDNILDDTLGIILIFKIMID